MACDLCPDFQDSFSILLKEQGKEVKGGLYYVIAGLQGHIIVRKYRQSALYIVLDL